MIPYNQLKDDHWDAVVIGSGIGGMTAAAILAKKAGKKVLVLERHYTPGGFTHSFDRPGYTWDVGVHYVGDLERPEAQTRAAFDWLSEGRLEWASLPDVYDRVLMAGQAYEFPAGKQRLREQLIQYFPGEARAIEGYFRAVESAQRAGGLYFAEKAVPRPIARLAGGFMRRPFLQWTDRTTREVLSELTRNEELIGLLTAQWGDYGLPPGQSSFGVHAVVMGSYFEGASYPVGGAGRIFESIAPLIERAGGEIVVSAEVSEIVLGGGKATGVRMADGRTIQAPLVISDAGARNTFGRLMKETPTAWKNLERISGSLAHLSLYAGVRQSAEELGLTGTNLWICPSPNHDENLERYLRDPEAEFPMVFISFPSAKDPEFAMAHPGRATLEVVTLAAYDWFARWENTRWKKRGADYDAFKTSLAERLQVQLEEHVPSLRGKIDYAELSTPLSTRHFMNYERGETYGLAMTPERFRARSLGARTEIRNLFLTGQDVTTLGVAGAMFGGAVAASAILGKNMVSELGQPRKNR